MTFIRDPVFIIAKTEKPWYMLDISILFDLICSYLKFCSIIIDDSIGVATVEDSIPIGGWLTRYATLNLII